MSRKLVFNTPKEDVKENHEDFKISAVRAFKGE